MKNPFLNAALAALYIVAVVFVMDTVTSFGREGDGEEFLVLPMAILSLLVLSVATMGFLFGYQPFHLYSEGKKTEAVKFFLLTLLSFACFVGFFVATYLLIA